MACRSHEMGYSLQSVRKNREGASHPDRNAQFEHINATADEFLERGEPVISVDTKKKELVGDFKNAGKEWQPKATPEQALVHDFPNDATGKAIPYGVYDMARNEAYVNVGRDHDTPAFAVARDVERVAERRDAEQRRVLIDELHHHFPSGSSSGFASKAATFFWISMSASARSARIVALAS
jgi:hypothetical protein